jgi:hypothetical protein
MLLKAVPLYSNFCVFNHFYQISPGCGALSWEDSGQPQYWKSTGLNNVQVTTALWPLPSLDKLSWPPQCSGKIFLSSPIFRWDFLGLNHVQVRLSWSRPCSGEATLVSTKSHINFREAKTLLASMMVRWDSFAINNVQLKIRLTSVTLCEKIVRRFHNLVMPERWPLAFI